MAINPQDYKPAATFDLEMKDVATDTQGSEPPASLESAGAFYVALYSDEQKQNLVGYMSANGLCYAMVAPRENACIVEKYQSNGVTYYQSTVLNASRYLSVSRYAYVGWYLWNGATGWTLEPNGKFTSLQNGQNLSVGDYKNPSVYMFAWNAYPQLFVKFEGV